MEIKTKLHTVYLLVGPTKCGKTTFAKQILKPSLYFEDEAKGFKANIQYISSDEIRQQILGYVYDKYDQVMLEASAQAFELLYKKIDLVTTFPINAEFVIVDTTGLSEDFRIKVRDIARNNHYNVEIILFDYKERDDYLTSERSHRLITNHLTRLRKEVLPVISREKYDRIHRIKQKDFLDPAGCDIVIENKEQFLATLLPHDKEYIIVGDVHECVDELIALIEVAGFDIENNLIKPTKKMANKKILLLGDWIDKGGKTKEIIEFLHANRCHIIWTLGNHESFVYRYLKNEIKGAKQTIIDNFFTSITYLAQNPEIHKKFEELVALAQPFYHYIGSGDKQKSFYITHAPCENKYIGKLDAFAMRAQRYFKLERELPTEPQFQFIKDEASTNHPYHFFGHVAVGEVARVKNKILLDTGCVSGNKLTGVEVSFKLFFKSVKSTRSQEKLPILFKCKQELDPRL